MFGFNLGGDAWPGYYGPSTGNKGSCYKEDSWTYLKRCGPVAVGWRCYGDRRSFGEAPERDVDALWGIGQVNPLITTVQPGTPENPQPLRPLRATGDNGVGYGWLDLFPKEIEYWRKYGLNPPVSPFNENIDHSTPYEAMCDYVIALAEHTDLNIWVPAAAMYNPDFDRYVQAMDRAYRHEKVGGIVVHYYVRDGNDLAPGLVGSPEWFCRRYGKPVIVGEVGVQKDYIPQATEAFKMNVALTLLRRWLKDPLVYASLYYTLETNDEAWKAFWPTPRMADLFVVLAREARAVRAFPQTPAAVVPVPTPATGGVTAAKYPDLWAEWIDAGGAENNFRKHAIGLGVEPVASYEDVQFLAREAGASVNQLLKGMETYRPR